MERLKDGKNFRAEFLLHLFQVGLAFHPAFEFLDQLGAGLDAEVGLDQDFLKLLAHLADGLAGGEEVSEIGVEQFAGFGQALFETIEQAGHVTQPFFSSSLTETTVLTPGFSMVTP